MTNEQLSDWSAPGEKPPCVGVWETDFQNEESPTFQYFDGRAFRSAQSTPKSAYLSRKYESWCNQSKVRFRGLMEKPE